MTNEIEVRRGDLVISVFGGDIRKPRPAVVIQSDFFNRTHSSIVLCPLSSDLMGLPLFRVKLEPTETNGLKRDSEIMIDKLGAVDRDKIRQRIGRLSAGEMKLLDDAVRRWLHLSEARIN